MLPLIMVFIGGIIITKKKLFSITFFIMLFSLISLAHSTTVKAASKINDYIISNKIKPAAIQNQEGTFS